MTIFVSFLLGVSRCGTVYSVGGLSLSLWYEPSWGVDYAMRNVSDVSVDVSDVSECNATRPLALATR